MKPSSLLLLAVFVVAFTSLLGLVDARRGDDHDDDADTNSNNDIYFSKESKKKKDFKYSKEANSQWRSKAGGAKLKHHHSGPSSTVKPYNDPTRTDNDLNRDRFSSSTANLDEYRPPKNYSTSSERLFRMQKIQNIWQKAQKVLNEIKLKALFHDLKTQDKREVEYKKIKTQGKDKDGLKEAALRAQLSAIVDSYGLLGSFPEHEVRDEDGLQIDRMFKDKKLNKLWKKIESAGLDEREMKILKEELDHHQMKVDQYYAFVDNLHDHREKTPEQQNSVEHFLEDEVVGGNSFNRKSDGKGKKSRASQDNASSAKKNHLAEEIRVKHQEIKDNFEELAEKVRAKLNEQEFLDDKTVRLWDLAKKADFTPEELASLRAELHHFEHRMKKLHYFTNELEMKENPDEAKPLKTRVGELQQKVEKLHDELRGRIARRTEL